jgi:hypothetical protein
LKLSRWLPALALLAACALQPRLTDELTFEGLVRVEDSGFDLAWVRPNLDVRGYTKVMLQGAGIEYRPVQPVRGPGAADQSEFALSEKQKGTLRELVRGAFVSELSRSERFALVSEPGADVLLLRGALLDVVSFVPPERAMRERVLLGAVGEATLVLELRDSLSEAILARVVDRRAAERSAGMMGESDPVSNAYDVERAARTWARLARERLEDLPKLAERRVRPDA